MNERRGCAEAAIEERRSKRHDRQNVTLHYNREEFVYKSSTATANDQSTLLRDQLDKRKKCRKGKKELLYKREAKRE